MFSCAAEALSGEGHWVECAVLHAEAAQASSAAVASRRRAALKCKLCLHARLRLYWVADRWRGPSEELRLVNADPSRRISGPQPPLHGGRGRGVPHTRESATEMLANTGNHLQCSLCVGELAQNSGKWAARTHLAHCFENVPQHGMQGLVQALHAVLRGVRLSFKRQWQPERCSRD